MVREIPLFINSKVTVRHRQLIVELILYIDFFLNGNTLAICFKTSVNLYDFFFFFIFEALIPFCNVTYNYAYLNL